MYNKKNYIYGIFFKTSPSKELIKLLSAKGYDCDLHEHSALFTVEDSNKLRGPPKKL